MNKTNEAKMRNEMERDDQRRERKTKSSREDLLQLSLLKAILPCFMACSSAVPREERAHPTTWPCICFYICLCDPFTSFSVVASRCLLSRCFYFIYICTKTCLEGIFKHVFDYFICDFAYLCYTVIYMEIRKIFLLIS